MRKRLTVLVLTFLIAFAALFSFTPQVRAETGSSYDNGYNTACRISAKKHTELSGCLNKKYTYLAKKAPKAVYQDAAHDPAGIGGLYIFQDSTGTTPYFRYNQNTKKPSFVQLSNAVAKSVQSKYSIFGVYLNMKTAAAKKALTSARWKYSKKEKGGAGTKFTYKKSGHTFAFWVEGGKVAALQWIR